MLFKTRQLILADFSKELKFFCIINKSMIYKPDNYLDLVMRTFFRLLANCFLLLCNLVVLIYPTLLAYIQRPSRHRVHGAWTYSYLTPSPSINLLQCVTVSFRRFLCFWVWSFPYGIFFLSPTNSLKPILTIWKLNLFLHRENDIAVLIF